MAIEIRTVPEEELDRAHFLLAYSFHAERSQEGRMTHVESMGPLLGLYEDGEIVACLRVFPLRMFIHGASIPLGGVCGVACLPEHRRKGYVGQLLRHSLAAMREDGQAISALYTPHPALYRRYGWMYASEGLFYRFKPKEIRLAGTEDAAGRARRLSDEEWPTLERVYREFASPRNGYLDRDEHWWKEAVFHRLYDEKRRPNDVAVWEDGSGESKGYLVYHSTSDHRTDGPPTTKTVVEEFQALEPSAYAGLLRYLLSHDLATEIALWAPADEPLSALVEDPWQLRREHFYGFMLRIVDLEKAVAARPPAAAAPEGAFTIHIADASAPRNQGVWRIECSGGQLAATRSDGAPDLSTDAAAFAAMYNGFLRPSQAARSGLARISDPGAAALADRILATDYPPHPQDFF